MKAKLRAGWDHFLVWSGVYTFFMGLGFTSHLLYEAMSVGSPTGVMLYIANFFVLMLLGILFAYMNIRKDRDIDDLWDSYIEGIKENRTLRQRIAELENNDEV